MQVLGHQIADSQPEGKGPLNGVHNNNYTKWVVSVINQRKKCFWICFRILNQGVGFIPGILSAYKLYIWNTLHEVKLRWVVTYVHVLKADWLNMLGNDQIIGHRSLSLFVIKLNGKKNLQIKTSHGCFLRQLYDYFGRSWFEPAKTRCAVAAIITPNATEFEHTVQRTGNIIRRQLFKTTYLAVDFIRLKTWS